MDIKIPDSLLRRFLETNASAEKVAEALTLCGPSVDRLEKVKGDTVFEIEAITNRVDSASTFGIAREASAILPLFGIKAKLKDNPYDIKASELPKRGDEKLKLEVEIKDETLVNRFAAIVLDQIKVKESPEEMKSQLNSAGIRSISNLVDITNYLTLCYGQPVHIFDYDKIKGHQMILRESKRGEAVVTLDDKSHKLLGGDIVIEDGEGRLIDLCGIMGAKNSEVDESTTRAVLFVQTYHPKKIRRTSLYTQERTLAAQIFEKQPDSRLVAPTLIEGVKFLIKYANARIASDSIDLYFKKPEVKTVNLDIKWLNQLIGHKFDQTTVTSILKNLGFVIKKKEATWLTVEVPSWRANESKSREDLVEEIARVYGYFRLESNLAESKYIETETDPQLEWEYTAKLYLSHIGFTEIYNYSLVSQALFEKANMKIDPSVRLTNPLAGEFEYMRRSLIPSLLLDLSENQGKAELPIRIFELSNIYLPADRFPLSGMQAVLVDKHGHKDEIPKEKSTLILAGKGDKYQDAKGFVEALLHSLGIKEINYQEYGEKSGPWLANQTAEIYSGKHFLGVLGNINAAVRKNFGFKDEVFLANLDFTQISNLANRNYTYQPSSPYPDIIDEVTITSDRPVGELLQYIKQTSLLLTAVSYLSSYKDKHSFRLHFNNPKKNLTQKEVDIIKEKLLKLS